MKAIRLPKKTLLPLLFVLVLVSPGIFVNAETLDHWHWRNPFPQGNSLTQVAHGNNTFVAVGYRGTILTSPDALTWTPRTSGTPVGLYGIAFGNNIFVAVGENGTIRTSIYGVIWTERTSGTSAGLYGIAYCKNTFVAVGGVTLLTSPDGITWTPRASGASGEFSGVTYGDNAFVAVGNSGTLLTSPDGITWTPRASGTFNGLHGVAYGNNTFVVVGENGTIRTSPDGTTWTLRTPGFSDSLSGVAYGDNTFVAVGGTAWYGSIFTSPDGITWTRRISMSSDELGGLGGVTYADNTFVAVGYSGAILTSPDGVTWTQGTSITITELRGGGYGNDTFVVVGGFNGRTTHIFSSPDGITWTARSSGSSNALLEVAYGNNTFVAVGFSGTILTSPDGVIWTPRTSGTSCTLMGVAYGNDTFVGVGGFDCSSGPMVLTSPDGATWTPGISYPSSFVLTDVAYGNNIFVAVGSYFSPGGGIILTSPDGVIWTPRVSGGIAGLWGVAYGNNTFVVVGPSGTIFTSPDGVNWWSSASENTGQLFGAAYGNNTFVTAGTYGTILTSPDGVNWTKRASGTSNTLHGAIYGDNTFLVVGEGGTILQSDPLVGPTVSCTVTTEPQGLEIVVDSLSYISPQTFDWSEGSPHTISAPSPQIEFFDTQYVFSYWSDGYDRTHTVTTPSSITTYSAAFVSLYSLTTSANPAEGGTITPTGENWFNKGETVVVSAKANPGYGFSGWSRDLSGNVNPTSITMNGPKNVTANFSLRVTLLDPNGGEAVPSGGIYPVSWTAPSQAGKFALRLSMDSGLTWSKVGENLTGLTYDWPVPVTKGNKKGCLLKVIGYDSSGARVGADTSDGPFQIQTVILTSPNEGGTFNPGDLVPIAWTINETAKPITKVMLYYTKNAGATWKRIDTLSGGSPSGEYNQDWLVPSVGTTPKTKCKIKVMLKDANGNNLGSDISDEYFTISNPTIGTGLPDYIFTGFGNSEVYRGQTFHLSSEHAVRADKLRVYVGPTNNPGANFHILLTEMDMTGGFHPTTVIFESKTLNVPNLPARRGPDEFVVKLGELLLQPGRDYAWILDHFVVGNEGVVVSMGTGTGSYSDGRSFRFINGPSFPNGTRQDHFASDNWFVYDDPDFAFQLEFTILP